MRRNKQIEEKVNVILHNEPATRDDDNLLFAKYLDTLEDDYDFSEVQFALIVKQLATKFKTVERSRRKLQADNPLIRGEKWHARHGEIQDAFIQYALDIE